MLNKLIDFIFNTTENILVQLLIFVLGMTGKKQEQKNLEEIRQGIRFLMVGVWNLLCSYIVYALCIFFGFYYLFCHVISFLFSVLNSFYWTRRYVFKEQGNLLLMLGKVFLSFVGTGLLLQGVLLILWVDVLHVPEIAAPLLNICVLTPVNFILQKFWAYK